VPPLYCLNASGQFQGFVDDNGQYTNVPGSFSCKVWSGQDGSPCGYRYPPCANYCVTATGGLPDGTTDGTCQSAPPTNVVL
jgi:hypothetical protein